MSSRVLAIAAAASCALAGPVHAGPDAPAKGASTKDDSSTKEAGKHFQRGVALFQEADYRAALVEFRRAYVLAPNSSVLYNLGQTYYQLQNYAAALTALERFLVEAPANATHRREVEQTIEVLRTRVGKVAVVTNVPGCEITVDDELVGKTPLAEPLTVSIGRRKVTAIHAGHAPETRFIDVTAGETADVALTLPVLDARGAAAASSKGWTRDDLITPGWIATGVLGAGAVTTGVFAYLAARDLKDARTSLGATRADLDHKSSRVVTLSAVADVLAAATLITGGITLTLQWTKTRKQEVRVAVTPNAILLSGVLP